MTRGKPNGLDRDLVLIPGPRVLTWQDWRWADIPPPDYLMGEVFSTTSRILLSAPTGLGKTNLAMAVGLAKSDGENFLHWRAGRDGPAKVLYVDGEMSKRLTRRRFIDTVRRAGLDPDSPDVAENFKVLCYDFFEPRPPPLNTPEGQECFERLMIADERPDFIIFDNVQALLAGKKSDEETWEAIVPWTYSLTRQNVGQLWIDHTGHDKTRPYGSSTKSWQMDTSILLEEIERPGTDIAFKLKFLKARERTPENRADFEPVIITLERDRWLVEKTEERKPSERAAPAPSKPQALTQADLQFYNALTDALCTASATPRRESANRPSVTQAEWSAQLVRTGAIDKEAKPDSARSLNDTGAT